jgi:hypothetical protein
MIGNLLKELFPALGRFFAFQLSRPFRRALNDSDAPLRADRPSDSISALAPEPEKSDKPSPPAQRLAEVGLDPAYLQKTRWPTHRDDTPPSEVLSDPFYIFWTNTRGGHKWSQYFRTYREVFEPLRHEPVQVLEIGVNNGAGLQLWRQYFDHPDSRVVGIDIQELCAHFDKPSKNVHVRIGSQADPDFLAGLVKEFGKFDIIIDDGSHVSSHMITSFNVLFGDGLKESGIYLVEDLHANYWFPWRDTQRSFIDLTKDLIEYMHAHYVAATGDDHLLESPSKQKLEWVEVPRITTMIREIRYFDSIVVIYKSPRGFMPFGLYGSTWASSFFND